MSSAIERLAAELTKLPNDEWARLVQRQMTGLEMSSPFGPAWEEISERVVPHEWRQATEGDERSVESLGESNRKTSA